MAHQRTLQAALLLLVSMLAVARACSPMPGWTSKTVAQLVPDTPVVLVVNITRVDGDINIQEATATVHCVLKHANATTPPSQLLGRSIRITRYGSSAMCRSEAVVGASHLVMLQLAPPPPPPPTSSSSNSSRLPTYSLVYADISSGARPATPANIAAARAALTPQQLAAAVCRTPAVAPLVLPGRPVPAKGVPAKTTPLAPKATPLAPKAAAAPFP